MPLSVIGHLCVGTCMSARDMWVTRRPRGFHYAPGGRGGHDAAQLSPRSDRCRWRRDGLGERHRRRAQPLNLRLELLNLLVLTAFQHGLQRLKSLGKSRNLAN